MSDTPRTDAYAHECLDGDLNGAMVVSVLIAQQLERELAEANRIIKECLSVMPVGYIPSHTPENLPAKIQGLVKELAENTTIRHERVAEELAKVTKQRDELLEALNKLLDKVTDIRGIDIELYAPKETEAAKQVIKKIKEKIL